MESDETGRRVAADPDPIVEPHVVSGTVYNRDHITSQHTHSTMPTHPRNPSVATLPMVTVEGRQQTKLVGGLAVRLRALRLI